MNGIVEGLIEEPGEGVTVKYEFSRPVEIGKFSESLEGLADIYRAKVSAHYEASNELRLFIKEIRKGSVEVDLIEMVRVAGGALAPVASDVKIIVDAMQRAKQVIDWLSGDAKGGVHEPTKKEVEAISHFVAPIAENHGSAVQINVTASPGAQIYVGSPQANEIQANATRAIEAMKTPVKEVFAEVPLEWVQTDRQGATTGRTGLKAIVEEISPSPTPVYFSESERAGLMKSMIEDVEFPYKKTFIVDIETIVVQGRLKGYKIIRLHDVLM